MITSLVLFMVQIERAFKGLKTTMNLKKKDRFVQHFIFLLYLIRSLFEENKELIIRTFNERI